MPTTQIKINIDSSLTSQAQTILADLGLDMTAAINLFLRQIVYKEPLLFITSNGATDDSLFDIKITAGKSVKFGGWEGKAAMAEDFNAPLESVSSTPKEKRREILRSLYGSINDPTFSEPIEAILATVTNCRDRCILEVAANGKH